MAIKGLSQITRIANILCSKLMKTVLCTLSSNRLGFKPRTLAGSWTGHFQPVRLQLTEPSGTLETCVTAVLHIANLLTCYIEEDSVQHIRKFVRMVTCHTSNFFSIDVLLGLETDSADQFLSIPISCSVLGCHVYVILAKCVTTWIKNYKTIHFIIVVSTVLVYYHRDLLSSYI